MIRKRSTLLVLAVTVAVSAAAGPPALVPRTAAAQPYARFAVPDSALVPAACADPETRAPFYWAPFVLMGASGPLR